MKTRHTLFALPLMLMFAFGSGAANAGWILIADEWPEDGGTVADNPAELPWEPPYNNNPNWIAAWIQDLEDLEFAPSLLDQGDIGEAPSRSAIWQLTNINPGAQYLSLHYGNFPGGFGLSSEYGNVMLAFRCAQNEISCSTFSAPWRGLSNYRVYGTSTRVPEPATLALLGAGLLGMGLAHRRRREAAAT